VSMRKDDGTTVETGLDGGESTDLDSTPTPGLAVDAIPYDDLVAVLGQAKEAFADTHVAQVYAGRTGKPFITGHCAYPENTPKAQLLDGKKVEQLPDLSSAASIDKAIADITVLTGSNLTEFSLVYNATVGESPQVRAAAPVVTIAGEKCSPLVLRHKTWIQFPPHCTPSDNPSPQKLDLSQITGAKLEAALKKAMAELKATSTDDLQAANVVHSTDGALVLEVLLNGESTMAVVPLG